VILYESLTGKPPFKGEGRSAILEAVKTREPVPPRHLRAEIPPSLEAICLKCVEKEPAQRYASAAALADDLERWLQGRSTTVRPLRWPVRMWRAIRRRRAVVLVALLLLGTAAGTAGLIRLLSPAPLRPKPQADPDAPLREIERELAAGRPVTLLGETGLPAWSRWRMGEKDAGMRLLGNDELIVTGWPATLLELLPNPQHTRYRIHAEVKHRRGGESGGVGLYFAARRQATSKGPVTSFFRVMFNDLINEKEIYKRMPDMIRRLRKEPKGNRVIVSWFYKGEWEEKSKNEGEDKPIAMEHMQLDPEIFDPAGYARKAGPWRELDVIVTPEAIRVLWKGVPIGPPILPAKVEQDSAANLAAVRKKSKPNAPVQALDSRVDLRGGMGPYVENSDASFRNVRVEPLDGAKARR
jgi:serine/threonine-protein kinase